ncbi:MAG: sulfatase family protein [Planctomycetota bacterium]
MRRLIVLFALIVFGFGGFNTVSAQQPNFILFFPDQLRAAELQCYGNQVAITPNIDSLADNGLRFEIPLVGLPVCTPCRASIQTGRMPFAVLSDAGEWMTANRLTLADAEITIAEELNPLGYTCGYVGKWHLEKRSDCLHNRQGYSYFELPKSSWYNEPAYCRDDGVIIDEPGRWLSDVLADRAINFVNNNAGNPFFLFWSPLPPHAPGNWNWSQDNTTALPIYFDGRMDLWALFDGMTIPLRDNIAPEDRELAEKQIRIYNALTSGLDQALGRVRDTLTSLGIADNTIIIVSADHGSQLGSHGTWEKNVIYEESIRVPLIVYDPRHANPAVHSAPIHLIDVMPTILDLAGGGSPQRAQGRSFAPLITGQGTYVARDAAMVQFGGTTISGTGYGRSRVLRTDKSKLAACEINKPLGTVRTTALFDLDSSSPNYDPYEMNNLIGHPDYQDISRQLWDRLLLEMQTTEDPLLEVINIPSMGLAFIDPGLVNISEDLDVLTVSEGNTEPVDIGGRYARKNLDPVSDIYMFYAIDDSYAFEGSLSDVYITVDYYDAGSGSFSLEYDAAADIYKNGGSITLTGTDTWQRHTFHVTDAWFGNRQSGGADFRIAGVAVSPFYIDLVCMTDNPSPLPDLVTNPVPTDQNVGVRIDEILSWSSAARAISYNVFFGSSYPPEFQGNQVGTTFDPGPMTALVSYYWRIDPLNVFGITAGEEWSFTTTVDEDQDRDCDVDHEDFGIFQLCLSGTGVAYEPGCEDANLDGDNDVDLDDFTIFQACMAGANNVPGC